MSGKKTTLLGLAQAMGTVFYIVLVALLMVGLSTDTGSFDGDGQAMECLGAVGILLLFVISACITGTIVLGYPAILALRLRIREAVLLVAATVGWLVVLLVVIVAIIGSGVARVG